MLLLELGALSLHAGNERVRVNNWLVVVRRISHRGTLAQVPAPDASTGRKSCG